ncbi:HAD family hydrolase [Martelella alba]|uniref:HAD family hydrolase n=1 Tax=Martelella alba TaxID=2590451 RepID=A0A506UE91_9HYPH|nr:HAD family hydrolase [Martelella alba]TPW32290.1 HAD family hydrolase [Martelella alba]
MPDNPLIIFDCDGVLVDSEPISLSVLQEALAAEGIVIGMETASRLFLGRSLATMISVVAHDFGVSIGPDFLESMRARLYARFRAELKPIPGILDTWQALADHGIDWCVASSSQPERIHLSLEICGLLPRFSPLVFSASMVRHGKPAPDLFLYAATQMRRDPASCIVIEDSPAGIEAAKAAGMRSFAFLGGSHMISASLRSQIAALHPDLQFDVMPELVQRVTG